MKINFITKIVMKFGVIGILGAVYDNPGDPRTLVPSPNGMQMIFNAAKPGYRYFMLIIVGVIILFLGYIFVVLII